MGKSKTGAEIVSRSPSAGFSLCEIWRRMWDLNPRGM